METHLKPSILVPCWALCYASSSPMGKTCKRQMFDPQACFGTKRATARQENKEQEKACVVKHFGEEHCLSTTADQDVRDVVNVV